MKISAIPLLLFGIGAHIQAEEENPKFETLLGYRNVTVTKVRPDSIQIVHESGVKTIPFEDIPVDIRQKLGLNQQKAEAHRFVSKMNHEIAADKARTAQFVKENRVTLHGEILQVLENGVLLRDGSYSDGTKTEKKIPYQMMTSGPTGLYPNAPKRYATYYRSEWVLKQTHVFDVMAVSCDPTGLTSGGEFSRVVYKFGTESYKTMGGTMKTVKAFTTDLREALARVGLDL